MGKPVQAFAVIMVAHKGFQSLVEFMVPAHVT